MRMRVRMRVLLFGSWGGPRLLFSSNFNHMKHNCESDHWEDDGEGRSVPPPRLWKEKSCWLGGGVAAVTLLQLSRSLCSTVQQIHSQKREKRKINTTVLSK